MASMPSQFMRVRACFEGHKVSKAQNQCARVCVCVCVCVHAEQTRACSPTSAPRTLMYFFLSRLSKSPPTRTPHMKASRFR